MRSPDTAPSLTAFGAPISDPARFSMFPLPAGSETGAPGAVSGSALEMGRRRAGLDPGPVSGYYNTAYANLRIRLLEVRA